MIKVYTQFDSYVFKCDDIHEFVDNLARNGGIWYYNDNLFIPGIQITRIEKLKPKVQDGKN